MAPSRQPPQGHFSRRDGANFAAERPSHHGKGRLQMSPSGLTRGSMVGASAVVGMDPRVESEDDSKRKFSKEEHPEPAVHGKGRLQMSPSGLTRGSMVGASAVVGMVPTMDPRVKPEGDI